MINYNHISSSHSFKTRFFTTFFINIIKVGLGFISGVIIARSLGPSGYGDYNFLLGSFSSTISFIDMGASWAFYTFLSQKKRPLKFYLYYLGWLIIQFTGVLFLVYFVFPDIWREKIWLGHHKKIIILAFIASFMMAKVWEMVSQAGESIRATVIVQLHNITATLLYLCIVLALLLLHRLAISNLFLSIASVYFLLSFILVNNLRKSLVVKEEIKLVDIFNKFKSYCSPFILYNVITFIYSFLDIWLLQRFGGAAQQGFYSIGLRYSAVSLIATMSMVKVFWKEIGEANEIKDYKRIFYLYTKISRALCFVTAMVSCFLIPFSKEILFFFLGERYVAGWLPLAIMLLYPVYQSLGQINDAYLLATTHTKLRSVLSIIIMIVSLPITYLLLAPPYQTASGLGLGALGLALKTIMLAVVSVNVFTHFICKIANCKFYFIYQFLTIGSLLTISFIVKASVGLIIYALNISITPLILMLSAAFVYLILVTIIVNIFPQIVGLEKEIVVKIREQLSAFLKELYVAFF